MYPSRMTEKHLERRSCVSIGAFAASQHVIIDRHRWRKLSWESLRVNRYYLLSALGFEIS
jgi:hypothetical protein